MFPVPPGSAEEPLFPQVPPPPPEPPGPPGTAGPELGLPPPVPNPPPALVIVEKIELLPFTPFEFGYVIGPAVPPAPIVTGKAEAVTVKAEQGVAAKGDAV